MNNATWITHEPGTVYRIVVDLIREPDGGVSAISANLPGIGSQGDTPEEAYANVMEAAEAVLKSYRAAGDAIPWQASVPKTFGAERRVVVVNLLANDTP